MFPITETDESRDHAVGSAGLASAVPMAPPSSPRSTLPSDDDVSALSPSPVMAIATVIAYVMCAETDGAGVCVGLAKAVVVADGDDPTVADGVSEFDGERHCEMLLDDVIVADGDANDDADDDEN